MMQSFGLIPTQIQLNVQTNFERWKCCVDFIGHSPRKRSYQNIEEPYDSSVKKQEPTPPDLNLVDESRKNIEDPFNTSSPQLYKS